MGARLGIGLIGAGRMGSTHARILARAVPEARLVAIADLDHAAAGRLAEELEVEAVFGSPEELVAAPGVDAVLVAVSSRHHLDVVRIAAAAGRHILCEKPLALTIEETDAAIAAAEAAGVRLQVGFMRRFDPDYRRAKERLAGGALGRPTLFMSRQFDADPIPDTFRDPLVSGGIMVDMGIHEFDLARWLMDDEVVEVHAFGEAVIDEELGRLGDADNAVVNLRFAGGAVGSVELSRNASYGEDVRTEVLGPSGSVFVGLLPLGGGAFAGPAGFSIDTLPTSEPRFGRALAEQARAFARAILEDRPVEVGGSESRSALAIALAARRSLETGEPVRVVTVAG